MAKNKTPNRVPNGSGPKSSATKATTPPITLKPEPSKSNAGMLASKGGLKKEAEKKREPVQFIFEKQNYQWMFIGLGVLVLGFFLMSGTTDIMSSTKIVLAPLIVLVGFAIEFYAILLNPMKKA